MDSQNKRIAKNTIYMYINIFCTMFIGLYTSRIVLKVLGVSDYGLYNVVGGVLALFTFLVSSLSAATTRFFNVEMGKADGDVNRSFNINLALHTVFALIIFVLSELFGLWYIYHHLNIEPGKIGDAVFVYEVAIITTCIGIINSPYASIFYAYERFGFLTKFDIFNLLLRFSCIILLQFYEGDYVLRWYAMVMCFTTLNTCVVYHYIANKEWPHIIKLRIVYGWKYYKEVLSFNNWNLLATMAYMARSSGGDLIINSFFGTSVNGAFAVGKNVNSYVSQLAANFDRASAPQIVQSYASNNSERYYYLINKIGRMSLLVFELLFFPLFIELDFILHLWLGEVPEGALLYTQINLLSGAVAVSCGGIVQLINATGKIKWFKIELCIIFLASVPLCYLLLHYGFPAYSVLWLFLIADLIQRIIQLMLMKYVLGFDSMLYVKEAYIRPFVVALIMYSILLLYSNFSISDPLQKVTSIIVCFILTAGFVYWVGLKKNERVKVFSFIKSKSSLFF